jgi:putative membrane protein
MNYEEQETAKIAHNKAGENQALITYADTIRGDHEANEEAVSALSRQKSIKLEGTNPDKVEKNSLKDLSGGAFNDAYLDDQIKGHKEALSMFESAKGTYASDPDVKLYIEQTLPVLQAHLKMAQNLRRHVSPMSACVAHERRGSLQQQEYDQRNGQERRNGTEVGNGNAVK